jgi:hypothetical protein
MPRLPPGGHPGGKRPPPYVASAAGGFLREFQTSVRRYPCEAPPGCVRGPFGPGLTLANYPGGQVLRSRRSNQLGEGMGILTALKAR